MKVYLLLGLFVIALFVSACTDEEYVFLNADKPVCKIGQWCEFHAETNDTILLNITDTNDTIIMRYNTL